MDKNNHVHNVLVKWFGHSTFREGQNEIIQSVLAKRDTIVIKSTGGGKSLCYQLPSLLLEGLTVVISPLISLMEDQVRESREIGRKDVIAYHGGIPFEQREMILHRLHSYRLLYLSPEGIQNQQLIKALILRKVALFVVDEAHCISQWGHDFRTDYLKLASIRTMLGNPPCLAMTATATKEVKKDIVEYLRLQEVHSFLYSVDRKNIAMKVEKVGSEKEKIERLVQFLKVRQDAGMIYFSSRAKAEEITRLLMHSGLSQVAFYHGGMSAEERSMIQQQFMDGELRVVCATNAFGMGVNKGNIRYVVHYHFPSQLESYVQEMGRCSRDGKAGLSYVFAQEGDEQIPYRFLEQEFLSEGQIQKLIPLLQYKEKNGETPDIDTLTYHLQCSEKALQLAFYHLEQIHTLENKKSIDYQTELFERIERQRKKRAKKIADMYYWLQLDKGSCRRRFILEYFSENNILINTFINNADPCCDLCDLLPEWMEQDIDDHSDVYSSVHHIDSIHGKPHWKEKLDRLWPVK
jgi:ATP-dependent DNA helicase RecQ